MVHGIGFTRLLKLIVNSHNIEKCAAWDRRKSNHGDYLYPPNDDGKNMENNELSISNWLFPLNPLMIPRPLAGR